MQYTTPKISKLVQTLRKNGAVILLESQMQGHPSSNKSFLAAHPTAWIKAYGTKVEVLENGVSKIEEINPWVALSNFRNNHQDWLFGYLGYDLKNHIENLESKNGDLLGTPDMYFMKPSLLFEIDKNENIRCIKGKIPEVSDEAYDDEDISIELTHQTTKSAYVKQVEKAQQEIYEGDYYEINISHPLQYQFKGDSWNLYNKMKAAGPVPFGGYVETDDISICCSSPERFLAKKGNIIWSQPIKGTASRKSGVDESNSIQKLISSEKERAENLMIVDLVRNDLGRVAKKGTVKVRNLFEIQSFETVHQMVSTVECEVKEDFDSIDLIKACFPMGSMTGAPKIAAMKAIERLENYKRGIYSGALGYFTPDNDFDFNVIIRSALIKNYKLVYPTGGAITSDSDSEAEWQETLLKARAITNVFDVMV